MDRDNKGHFIRGHKKVGNYSRPKGFPAWNKGIKIKTNTGRTHFKKGFTPVNKGVRSGKYLVCKCGKEFYRTLGRIRRGETRYCSKKCAIENSPSLFKIGHKIIGGAHTGHAHSEESRIKIGIGHLGKNTGEKAWNWIEDRTKLKKYGESNKDRGSPAHKYWSTTVKNRDCWRCKINNNDCEGKVVAHHILSWKKYPELRYEINNGITLCRFHHPRKRKDEIKLIQTFNGLVMLKN